MRTYFVIGLLLLLFSCSKKEEAPATTENFFAIGDQRYSITHAALLRVEQTGQTAGPPYSQAVIFTASGLEVVALAGDYFKLAGQGPLIGMVCYSAQPDRLDLGTYYVALRPPFKNGEMPIGFYNPSFDVIGTDRTDYWNFGGAALLSGKMTVDQKGQDLVIDCLFTGRDTTPVQIVYRGPLTSYAFRYERPSERIR